MNKELELIYNKLNKIVIKNNNKIETINDYFYFIELSSLKKFLIAYQTDKTFCNSIYRFLNNISRNLNLPVNKFFAVRVDSECIKGMHYCADLILEYLNNQDMASYQLTHEVIQ